MPGFLKRTGAGDHTLIPILASPALYQLGPPPPAPLLSCDFNISLFQDFSVPNPGSSWTKEDKLATVAAYQTFSSCCRIKCLRFLKIRRFRLTQQTESGLLGVSTHFIKVYSRWFSCRRQCGPLHLFSTPHQGHELVYHGQLHGKKFKKSS